VETVVANAISRKAELEARKVALDKELAEIDLFLRLHEKFSGTKDEARDDDPEHRVHISPDATLPAPDRKRGRPADFAQIMERVLTDVGRPLGRPEFVDELSKRGISIPSEDKPRYLGTILWRHRDVFRNLPGHGYWLRNRPYPQANYDPALDSELGDLLE
jgi:hypothetical protein